MSKKKSRKRRDGDGVFDVVFDALCMLCIVLLAGAGIASWYFIFKLGSLFEAANYSVVGLI